MLIAHEAPIAILGEVSYITDFQYALVHLFESHPKYYTFFKSSLSVGREVMLDNSIFELGVAFDSSKFAKYVEELKPTYYIVPDVLEECNDTIASYHKFVMNYPYLPGLKVGVVQGKKYDELVKCYRYMEEYSDYIAISFDYSYYQVIGKSTSIDPALATLERMADGRRKFINMLIADGIWNNEKPTHLLGCSLAREFKYYKNITNIRSVDTSNPVVAGILNQRYLKDIGLFNKPRVILADLISCELTGEQEDDIIYNIHEFRKICNG